MKRLLSLILTLSVLVCSVSFITAFAADNDLVNVALGAAVAAENGSDSSNTAKNAVDGDTDTEWHTSDSSKYAVYDLGRNYPVSQIKFSAYASSVNPIRFVLSKDMPSATGNLNNGTNFDTWRVGTGVTEISSDKTNFTGTAYGDPIVKSYADGEEPVGRYFTVYKYYSGDLHFKDLEIYTKESNVPVLTDIASNAYECVQNGGINAMNLATDGDDTTAYINTAGSAMYAVYDLGATYKISGIDMLLESEKNQIWIAASKNKPAATDFASLTAYESYAAQDGTTALKTKEVLSTTANNYKWTYDAGSEIEARYIVIYRQYSGTLKLYDLNVYVTSDNLIPADMPYDITGKARVNAASGVTNTENASDGDGDTYCTLPGGSKYITFDLGEVYSVSKVEAVLSNTNSNSSVEIVLSEQPPAAENLINSAFGAWSVNNKVLQKSVFSSSKNEVSYNDISYNARYLTIFQYYSGNVNIYEVNIYVPYGAYMSGTASVNVAKDKACFSLYEPNSNDKEVKVKENVYWQAVDGDKTTFAAGRTYGNNDASKAPRFVVDLGAEYKLDSIVLKPYGGGTTNVYVTNSNDFATANLTAVALDAATSNGTEQTYTTYVSGEDTANLNETGWRYIVADRVQTVGGHILGIYELEANATLTNAESNAAQASSKAYRISAGRDIYTTGTASGNLAKINDGIYVYANEESRVTAESGKRHYVYYDLGDSYEIAYAVVIPHNGYNGLQNGFEIVGANSADDFANNTCDTLATVAAYTKAGSTNAAADIWKLDTVAAYANNKYRYVGIKGASGSYINLLEFEVFAKGSSFTQALGSVKAEVLALDDDAAVNDVKVTSGGATTANGTGTYRVIAAAYDADDNMISAGLGDITFTGNSRSDESFEVIIKDIVTDDTHHVRAFIVDDLDSVTPAMSEAVKVMVSE